MLTGYDIKVVPSEKTDEGEDRHRLQISLQVLTCSQFSLSQLA